jgi:hypothetical protein
MDDWCILRMAAGSTLSVAKGLADAGYDVWTPVEQQQKRVRASRTRVKVDMPMMPSFVFARDDRLADLLALSKSPGLTYQSWDAEQRKMVTRGIPFFRVFRYLDAYPRIADRHLDPLRQAEQRRQPREKARRLMPGTKVRFPYAGFDGLVGRVEESKGRYALVCFPGFSVPIKIASDGLLPVRSAA